MIHEICQFFCAKISYVWYATIGVKKRNVVKCNTLLIYVVYDV